MAVVSLVRRRTQLDLLDRAIEAGVIATVRLRNSGGQFRVRLAERGPRGVSLSPIDSIPTQCARNGAALEITFSFEDQYFTFPSETRGLEADVPGPAVLRIATPLRVELRAGRCAPRRVIPAGAGWRAGLEPVFANARVAEMRITNFSSNGMAGRLIGAGAGRLRCGEVFRVTVEVPGAPSQTLLARLAHQRIAGGAAVVGLRFCHGEDRDATETRLARLDQLAARAQNGPGTPGKCSKGEGE